MKLVMKLYMPQSKGSRNFAHGPTVEDPIVQHECTLVHRFGKRSKLKAHVDPYELAADSDDGELFAVWTIMQPRFWPESVFCFH